MTSDETKNYIDQRLHELGFALQLDDRGYEKIHRFTNGTESGVNQLCFKLASLTADSDEREVTTERVTKAIDELARIDDMMRRATKSDVHQANEELERSSIDQLAAMLEANAAAASATAEAYAPPRPAARANKAAAKRAASERRPKILIVNESKTTRGLLVKALTPDFECIETADADDAWRRLVHQTDIELVITDVRAHDRTQYDLIGRVRSAAAPAHLIGLPIIAIAATEDAHAKQRALVAGANDVIAMNTSAGELKARVSARYKASRVAPQYGTPAKPAAGERAPERKRNAIPPPAQKPASRPAVTSTIAALAPGPLDSVRRPFLNTPDMMRRVPTAPSRFLAWLYKVSSTTTVTLSATILVVVLLAAIMYVNRMSDSPVIARAPEKTAPAPQASAPLTPPPTTTPSAPSTTQPIPPSTAQPSPSEPSTPLAAGSPTDRANADTKSRSAAKDELRRERESAVTSSPTSNAQARAETALPSESRTRPEPLSPAPRATESGSRPTTPATAPTTPLPTDNAVAREPEVGVDADVARSAAARPAAPERLTRDELATLLKRFAYVYEAGDIEQFMNLFSTNARTNDRANRDGIRQDYETLFRTTDLRQFKLSHINWEVDSNQAHGWGNFEVTVRRTGDQELHNYSGSLTLYVERIEGRPRIVRLFHGQRRAGS